MKKLLAIIVFGVAFGLVEAVVVYYLRTIFDFSSNYNPPGDIKVILNLGVISFLSAGSRVIPDTAINRAEVWREVATIVMLLSVSYLSGKNLKKRFAAFLISFATWDIFYYVFLYFLVGWPRSLMDIDVYFLNPVPWVGPVITPVVISALMFFVGVVMYL